MKAHTAIGLGIVHLVLVAIGAMQIDLNRWGGWGRMIRFYGGLSGSISNYSFFAPEVGSPMRASFEVFEAGGKKTTEGFPEANREITLRLGNIVDIFHEELDERDARRSLAASWASLILARHPGARGVKVRVDAFAVPTMKEFSEGKAAAWTELYHATFLRRRI